MIGVEGGECALKRFAFWSQKPFFVTALPVGLAGKKVVHFFLGETPQERLLRSTAFANKSGAL
ncbi:hypothetical protein BI350_14440 [Sporosarcina ureilytica]|uniref:Uncharacterized protein n=1 Tax=Sporosarcina ureilytica TaxID=298596 RepID=A0A1D8JIT7_9BACL|nr:hypothetical protein BI350_14440 [Sporosarcina ureilytica]